MNHGLSLKRALLHAIVVALVLGALLGIYVFLFGTFGRTEVRILLTIGTVLYFSITSLACAAAQERRTAPYLSVPGLAAGIAGFFVFIPAIWVDRWDLEWYAKMMGILAIFSFSLAQACLLTLSSLAPRVRWVLPATVGCIFALALLLSAMIVFEADNEWLFRIAGVLGILDGCGFLSIPILDRLGRQPPGETQLGRIELKCPRCGCRATYPFGSVCCEKCSLRMRVELDPEMAGSAASQAASESAGGTSVKDDPV